jgi:hypothetical protein
MNNLLVSNRVMLVSDVGKGFNPGISGKIQDQVTVSSIAISLYTVTLY